MTRVKPSDLRLAVEALPVHLIGGDEWECRTCHWHMQWPDDPTPLPCGHPYVNDGMGDEYDADGVMCDHGNLLDRDRVLAILTGLGL